MMNKIFPILILLFPGFLFPQINGTWNSYTSLKDTRRAAATEEGIMAISGGGAYYFDMEDENFSIYTKSGGLSSQELTSLGVDHYSRFWAGTQEGTINVITPQTGEINKILDISSTSMSLKEINDIFPWGDTIYIATDFSVSLINTESLLFIDTYQKFGSFLSAIPVYTVFRSDILYAATESGLAVQKRDAVNLSAPESWDIYSYNSDIPAGIIYRFALYRDVVLAATDNGVLSITFNNISTTFYEGTNVTDICVQNDSLFTLRDGSVHLFDGSSSQLIYTPEGFHINSISYSDDHSLLFSTDKGLMKYQNGDVSLLLPNAPSTNSFYSMTISTGGVLWGGTGRAYENGGIYSFGNAGWNFYDKESNPDDIIVNGFHAASSGPDGAVYMSSWGRGFTKIKDDVFTTYTTENTGMIGIENDPVFLVIMDVKADSRSNEWALNFESADKKALSVLTPDNNWYHYEISSPLTTATVITSQFAIDDYDTKWFSVTSSASQGPGLYYFNENNTLEDTDDDTWGFINTSDGMNSNEISDIAVDHRGELWIGTDKGVNIISNTQNPASRISSVFPLRLQAVSCIAVDPVNQKWVGTQKGVFVMSPDGTSLLENFTVSNSPLPSDEIRSITIDEENGIIYIGTDYGLVSFSSIFRKPAESFGELDIYPNPFRISQSADNNLYINGLIEDSEIKIISVSGSLIREFVTPGGRTAVWDGRDENNELVASGIYIIIAFDEEANSVATAKAAVIRK